MGISCYHGSKHNYQAEKDGWSCEQCGSLNHKYNETNTKRNLGRHCQKSDSKINRIPTSVSASLHESNEKTVEKSDNQHFQNSGN